MTQVRIEHVNITVSDPEASAAAIARIFGWQERWRGPAMGGGFTIHVGNGDAYLALYTGPKGHHSDTPYAKGEPLNHVGIEVSDLDAIEAKVVAEGYEPFSHGDYEPGRRFYFFDRDGIEFEVVSYQNS